MIYIYRLFFKKMVSFFSSKRTIINAYKKKPSFTNFKYVLKLGMDPNRSQIKTKSAKNL